MKTKNLIAWLTDPKYEALHGRTYAIRNAVLVRHLTGRGTLGSIAKRYGVSRPALTAHAARVRELFGAPYKARVNG